MKRIFRLSPLLTPDTMMKLICLLALLACAYASNLDFPERVVANKYINSLRRRVCPKAADMRFMHYKPPLQDKAKTWAETCRESNPQLEKEFEGYGVLTDLTSGDGATLDEAVKSWGVMEDYYDYDTNNCSYPRPCNPYLQLINAKTGNFGCYKQNCSTYFEEVLSHASFWVCVFDVKYKSGTLPYEKGPFCSHCAANDTCVDRLCDTPKF